MRVSLCLVHMGWLLLAACAAPGASDVAPVIELAANELHAGQAVEVRVAGFPPDEVVVVGAGRARSEFQVSERITTDGAGAGRAALIMPASATPGEPWVFVAMTADHDLRARTEPVRIAAAVPEEGVSKDGVLTVEGVVTGEGVECLAVRGDDGELYTLSGRQGGLEPGQRVRVSGEVAQMSFCMQGTTLEVHSVTPL